MLTQSFVCGVGFAIRYLQLHCVGADAVHAVTSQSAAVRRNLPDEFQRHDSSFSHAAPVRRLSAYHVPQVLDRPFRTDTGQSDRRFGRRSAVVALVHDSVAALSHLHVGFDSLQLRRQHDDRRELHIFSPATANWICTRLTWTVADLPVRVPHTFTFFNSTIAASLVSSLSIRFIS
jgi:hypothetical protein